MSQGVLNRKREIEYTQKQIEASVCTVRKASPEEIEKILNERGVSMGKRGPKPGFKRDKRVNEAEVADQQTIKGDDKKPVEVVEDLGIIKNLGDIHALNKKPADFSQSEVQKHDDKIIAFESLAKIGTERAKDILDLERNGYLKRVSKGFNYFTTIKLNMTVQKQIKALIECGTIVEMSLAQAKEQIKSKKREFKEIIKKSNQETTQKVEPLIIIDDMDQLVDELKKESCLTAEVMKGVSVEIKDINIPIARPPLGITPKPHDEKLLDEIISDHIPVRKPPLGIAPRKLHDRARLSGLISAICRYIESSYEVPLEWVIEYNELVCRVK